MPDPRPERLRRPFARLAALALALLALAGHASPAAPAAAAPAKPATPLPPPARQPRLEDFIAPPGSTLRLQPFMLHADLWLGIDQRAKLDTIVFVLDNGARACQVLSRDSTWAVDYTWVYPHNLLPPRWYDARSLIHTGDSLKLADDADIQLTFGTLRVGVRAASLKAAEAEAYRLWPTELPPALRGRLKLKLERARKALAGERDTEPVFRSGQSGPR
jgi:hypothetical protein